MAAKVRLSRPPIREAVIDFIFSGSRTESEALEGLASALLKEQWTKSTITETELEARIEPAKLERGDGVTQFSKSAVVGFALAAPNDQKILQLREDRLTISHVAAYEDWDELEQEAFDALHVFCKEMQPEHLARVGTRFINEIPIEPGDHHHARFLTSPPRMIPGLGQAFITDFIRRQVIRGLEAGCTAILNVGTLGPQSKSGKKALLLDIDVFKEDDLSLDLPELKGYLNSLRAIKNTIFFESVTEEALEPFR